MLLAPYEDNLGGMGMRTLKGILFAGLLGIFFIAIKGFGGAIKGACLPYAASLFVTSFGLLKGLYTGLFATAIIQSSSVVTSLAVSVASENVLPFAGAVGIVLGANIGTTITSVIVAVIGWQAYKTVWKVVFFQIFFNLVTVGVVLPLEYFTGIFGKTSLFLASKIPMGTVSNNIIPAIKTTSGLSVIVYLLLIILSIYLLTNITKGVLGDLIQNSVTAVRDKPFFVIFIFGLFSTCVVQSSSVINSFVILLAMTCPPVISFNLVMGITLGANLGTTFTALLASLAGTETGMAIAFVHILINLVGCVIFYTLRKPLKRLWGK